jgi:hypothetical protein
MKSSDLEPTAGAEERAEAMSLVGKRPECFSSTVKECLFVLTATMSIGMSSFLYGLSTVITASIGRDLKMSSAEITWIGASSACVPSPHPSTDILIEFEFNDWG